MPCDTEILSCIALACSQSSFPVGPCDWVYIIPVCEPKLQIPVASMTLLVDQLEPSEEFEKI